MNGTAPTEQPPAPPPADSPLGADGGDLADGPLAVEPEATPSGYAAHAVGARLRELADAEQARSDEGEGDGDEPEPEAAAAAASGGEPDTARMPLVALGLTPVTNADLAATDFQACPFCAGWGAANPDSLLDALPAVVERVAPFPQSPTFARCGECDGWGRVLTGARLGGPGIQPCPRCNGNGYTDVRGGQPPAPSSGGAAAPVDAPAAFVGPDPLRTPPPDGQPPAIGMVWNQVAYTWEYPGQDG